MARELLPKRRLTQEELEEYDIYWCLKHEYEVKYGKFDRAREEYRLAKEEYERKLEECHLAKEEFCHKEEAYHNVLKELEQKRLEEEQKEAENEAAIAHQQSCAKILFANGVSKEIIANSLNIIMQTLEEWLA
jgi:hypothetical protein